MLNETFSVIFKHRGPLENHSGLQDTFLSKKYLSKDNIFGKEILSLLQWRGVSPFLLIFFYLNAIFPKYIFRQEIDCWHSLILIPNFIRKLKYRPNNPP